MLSFDFTGKTAIVTGAGGGMGEAIAKMMATAGADVSAVDMKACPPGLAELDNITFYQGNLTDVAFVENVAKDSFERTGKLNYLANVAGVLWFDRDGPIFDLDLSIWDQVFDINLKSMVHTVRACTPYMKQTNDTSSMVHFSTIQWMRGDTMPQDAYATSKAAVSAFSRSIAMQLASAQIRSNVICPGPTLTPMQSRWDEVETQQAVANHIPMKKLGTPEDMAHTCLFLLSDASNYITGIDVVVDGGLIMNI